MQSPTTCTLTPSQMSRSCSWSQSQFLRLRGLTGDSGGTSPLFLARVQASSPGGGFPSVVLFVFFYLYLSLSLSNHLLQVRPFACRISFEVRNAFWVERRRGLKKTFQTQFAVPLLQIFSWIGVPGQVRTLLVHPIMC